MRFSARSNIDDVLGFTRRLHPQFQFAVATALTREAKAVEKLLPGELASALDRPSAFTSRGTFVQAARKTDLVSVVGFKDKQASYLKWQVQGGTRAPKRQALRLPSVVQLNDQGNLPPGLIRQLIARAQAGKRATRTQSRRFGVSQGLDLFYGEPGDGRPAGIYKRVAVSSTRHQLVPIVVFPKQSATYEKRFDFYGIAGRHAATHMPNHLRDAWAYAKATAK
jgi:hypothetical protein